MSTYEKRVDDKNKTLYVQKGYAYRLQDFLISNLNLVI